MSGTPRLRMFAGPNGSGKSTIKRILPERLLGTYINPDELEIEIKTSRRLALDSRGVEGTPEVLKSLKASILSRRDIPVQYLDGITLSDGAIEFGNIPLGPYLSSVCSDLLRVELLRIGTSMTFETVMSHPDKIEFLRDGQECGYRTYLYYVATNDPEINVTRVRSRVFFGGHDVPEDKIRGRYARSLDLLLPAIRHTNRAYIFDNSGSYGEHYLVAEVTDGWDLEVRCDDVPGWFKKAVIDRAP